MPFPAERPRRLRRTEALRLLVAETTLSRRHLIAPLFVAESLTEPREITSMPGQFQHTVASVIVEVEQLVALGVTSIILPKMQLVRRRGPTRGFVKLPLGPSPRVSVTTSSS